MVLVIVVGVAAVPLHEMLQGAPGVVPLYVQEPPSVEYAVCAPVSCSCVPTEFQLKGGIVALVELYALQFVWPTANAVDRHRIENQKQCFIRH